MTTQLIPRPVALLKLVELEPINYDHARIVCGWPAPEFAAIVRQLNANGLLGWVQAHEGEPDHPPGRPLATFPALPRCEGNRMKKRPRQKRIEELAQ
ncbi:MAG: hypothetical protein EON92_19495 [Burkholderiales bacterium]|nr:MAG: hypothetical protein EON92_19495 [Burkholderiales bacterium]